MRSKLLTPLLLALSVSTKTNTARSTSGSTMITDDTSVAANATFDYVIAGAGLTGIVVANKLSGQGYTVLVIEAGLDMPDNPGIYNAALGGTLANNATTSCNWNYVGSNENGTALPILIESGHCVGGSSSINGMVWIRPTTTEIDALETLGNPGWNSAALFPLMAAAENNTLPTDLQMSEGANVVPSVHGYSGVINTSFPTPMRIPAAQAIYKEAVYEVLGMEQSPDLSYRTGSVSSSTSWTIWYDPIAGINRRASAAYAWLYPKSQQRSTLTVLTSHIVGNVIFDDNLNAIGIKFGQAAGGPLYTVSVNKEVLLAAGTLGTPPILERSGVGSSSILEQFGIKQLVDLPGVGLNLQDQPGSELSALVYSSLDSNTSLIDDVDIFAPDITLPNLDQLFGDDALSITESLLVDLPARSVAAVDAGAAVNTLGAFKLFTLIADLITVQKMPIAEIIGESYPSVMTAIFWPLLPLSRGYIHINSSDPYARPHIVPRFLTDTFDVSVAVQAARTGRALHQSAAFASIIETAYIDAVPTNATDAQWAAWYESTMYGASHWLGTSAMRPLADGGVVSPELKVYGTNNLRVVDVSILPYSLTSHTMPMAYAVAQKAAELILADACASPSRVK